MCSCTGLCDCSALQFPQGPAGATGSQGEYGGFSSDWVFSTNTGSGTASTEIRLNNAAPASVTTIYINDTNGDSIDVSGFLAAMDNSGDFGLLRLFDETDNTTFAHYIVTSVTDNTTEYAIGVTYAEHNNTFSAADKVVVSFAASGADGAAGANGTNGVDGTPLLVNNTAVDTTTSGTLALIGTKDYRMPAGTLPSNGDKVFIRACLRKAIADNANVEININGNWFTASPADIAFLEGAEEMYVEAEFTRKTNTTAAVTCKWITSSAPSHLGTTGFTYENSASLGVLDFDGADINIQVKGKTSGGITLTCEQLTVEKHLI